MKVELQTTSDNISTLWEAVNNLRSNAQVVKVDPKLLTTLLLDHGKLYELFKEQIVDV